MDVFLLHLFDDGILFDMAVCNQLFMDENGTYLGVINHADEDEFMFNGHLLKKVTTDNLISF